MPFSDVLGQEQAAADLRHAIAADRVAHAYLFRGPDGVGKTRMALELAAALLCVEGKGEACGQCRNCRRIAHGNHPDVDLIEHPPDKRILSIDQIRAMQESAHRTAVEADWKIYILRDAERLTVAAQNTLLKILEEPPPGRVIILVTARPDRLVATILSRCHQVRFEPLTRDTMRELLARDGGFERDAIDFAVACAGGSMGRALQLLRTGAVATRDSVVPRLGDMRLGVALTLAEALNQAVGDSEKEMEGKRGGVRMFLDLLTTFYRDVVVLAEGGDEAALYHPACGDEARSLARRIGGDAAGRIVEALWVARDSIERNANIRLTLENALFTIAEIQAVAVR